MKKELTKAEEVAELLSYSDAEDIADAYLSLGITTSYEPEDIAKEIEECYAGQWMDDVDFTQNMVEELEGIPKDLPSYIHIDWEGTARDVMMDYSEKFGHYFRNI